MKFETHIVKPPIDKYLETIFHFKNFVPDHSIERMVPTGHVYIMFEFDSFVRNTYDNDSLETNKTFTKAWISGMHRNYISISSHKNSEMLVIQFKPYGTYPFLHFPLQNLNEKILPAEEVLGAEILILHEKMYKLETVQDKFDMIEKWLRSRFRKDKTPPTNLVDALNQLQTEPASNCNHIVESYSNTQKHLIDQFKKYVGLTPKYYQRILRFSEILKQIHQEKSIEWAQIAYQCNFSDQSHFIKEFKHFSGLNPKEFIKQDYNQDAPNFFPLDKEG